MDRDQVRTAVRATFAVLRRVAKRTRTPADDLMLQMLQANEERLARAVADLVDCPDQPPSDEQVAEALRRVGIDV